VIRAVRADEDVVPASPVRELKAKVRELERLLGRKTMEAEILRGHCHRRHRSSSFVALSVTSLARWT
jgi:hypothetical protein